MGPMAVTLWSVKNESPRLDVHRFLHVVCSLELCCIFHSRNDTQDVVTIGPSIDFADIVADKKPSSPTFFHDVKDVSSFSMDDANVFNFHHVRSGRRNSHQLTTLRFVRASSSPIGRTCCRCSGLQCIVFFPASSQDLTINQRKTLPFNRDTASDIGFRRDDDHRSVCNT